jgi:peptide/nickel transport system substrate-binding protein
MPIEEHALRRWIHAVADGKASRRQFMGMMLRLGLTGPLAAQLLATQVASASDAGGQAKPASFVPTRRGGGGKLRLLWWQAPTLLNAHLSSGLKDSDAARFEINPRYHVPNRPFFDSVELKGGGDATSAARAIVQTGEFDFAWNLQVEKDVLERLDRLGGRGKVHIYPGSGVEHIQLNRTNPWLEVNGEYSIASTPPSVPHRPAGAAVRQAYNLLVDRHTIAQQLYGAAGQATSNFLDSPPRFQSPHTRWEFSLDKAAQLLDQAGWRRGSDGMRAKDGHRMKLLYQTSVNPVRQKTQAIIKKPSSRRASRSN